MLDQKRTPQWPLAIAGLNERKAKSTLPVLSATPMADNDSRDLVDARSRAGPRYGGGLF